MEYRNHQYNAIGNIDMEIDLLGVGWVPFTASPDDVEAHGRSLFEQAKDSAAPYVDPDPQPEPVPQVVSRFQARAALHISGILAVAETAIAGADDLSQIAWEDAQEFRRSSPLVAAIALELGLSDSDVDDLFIQAAAIEA